MKVSPAFFRDPETKRLLDLAAAAAAVPVCIHTGNTMRLMGWGKCTACDWTNGRHDGKEACQACRAEAADTACRQQIPVTFVCHMGFTCVIANALKDTGFTIVLGPYLPAEAADAIEYAVLKGIQGLEKLPNRRERVPFSLADIRIVPQGAIRAATEWLLEGLRTRFEVYSRENAEEAENDLDGVSPTGSESVRPREEGGTPPPVDIAIVALALLCGRVKEPRAFLVDVFEEAESERKPPQASLIRTISEILDTVQNMGGHIDTAWNAYSRFVDEAIGLNTKEDLLKRAEKVLRCAAQACKGHFEDKACYMPGFMDLLFNDYASGQLLTRSAESAGVAPSSITRMTEKLTGANFSEVLGRIRITQARRLLRSTAMPAAGIAVLVGIKDQSNFGKLFLRYTGCTPGGYRACFHK